MMALPHLGDPPVAEAPSALHGSGALDSNNNDGFGQLLEQVRACYDFEVGRLQREMQELRGELLASSKEREWSGSRISTGVGDALMENNTSRPSLDVPYAPADVELPPKALAPLPCGDSSSPGGPPWSPAMSKESDALPRSPSYSKESLGIRQSNGSKDASGLRDSARRRKTMELENQRKGILWRCASSPILEVVSATVITLNGMFMAAEAQYEGFSLAVDTKHASAAGRSTEVWPHAMEAFLVIHWIFGVFFVLELLLKVGGLRREFVRDWWNWMDATLVVIWCVTETSESQINAQFLRLLRLARLVRLLRLIKFVQSCELDALFLLSTALKDSVSTVYWSFLTLLAIHLMLAIFLNVVLRELYFDPNSPKIEQQAEVFELFGSFSRSFLTAFEITLANWPTPVRVLVENVHEVWIVYAVVHKAVLGFAVVGVINAVLVQETFKAAALDDSIMVRQTRRKELTHRQKMLHLFNEADTNGDGALDFEEWKTICEDEWVQVWLHSQDIQAEDAERLFEWLDDDKDGLLTSEELVKGTAGLKGPAAVMNTMTRIQKLGIAMNDMNGKLPEQRHIAGANV